MLAACAALAGFGLCSADTLVGGFVVVAEPSPNLITNFRIGYKSTKFLVPFLIGACQPIHAARFTFVMINNMLQCEAIVPRGTN